MYKYFGNIIFLENTLLPYFCDEYPLISLNKQFSKLNHEKYNTHFQPHGILETYYLDTKTIEERRTYKNGELHGISECWYDTRSDERKINNDKLWCKSNYKNGKQNGLDELWYRNGNIWKKQYYKNGKLDGLSKSWHENGQLRDNKNYKDGNINGLYESWHQSGKLHSRINYIDGKLDGLCENWWDTQSDETDGSNGQLMIRYNYKNGVKDGLYEEWFQDGKPIEKGNYEDGKLISKINYYGHNLRIPSSLINY